MSITIQQADITTLAVDAIVNAAKNSLLGSILPNHTKYGINRLVNPTASGLVSVIPRRAE